MYNRYVPQSDGSFRRSRIPEPAAQAPTVIDSPVSEEPQKNEAPPPPQPRRSPQASRNYMPQKQNPPITHDAGSIGGFLKGLLPQNFDTEDLIVVLLLLLMSGNNSNDQNAALMTLGIYLFT